MAEWDLRKLRILRTLSERRTITATAAALFLTPSGVSQQLTALSKQLGVPLLEADGRGVRLTTAARLVLERAEAVFVELERADAELAAYRQGEAGEVRLGAFGTAIPALVVPAVAALRVDHPGLRVWVREVEAGEAYDLLADGTVDLSLTLAAHSPRASEAGFTRYELGADPLDVALPASHPLAGEERLRLVDLAAEPWIYGASGPWSQITTSVCEAAGFQPRRAHAAADWSAILALVGAGMGVALLPRMVTVATAPDVTVRVLTDDRPVRHVVAAVRRGAEEWPGVERVLDALRTAGAS